MGDTYLGQYVLGSVSRQGQSVEHYPLQEAFATVLNVFLEDSLKVLTAM
ncbi:hypothetical protein IQ268_03150 [Oculatella sp. LEGE 06141]|nr:hypothetical protein [Oculatella sp. LEGE 06141]MBE9177573.1 hypothetical protein [Oculatella sp. LEGE 06141]